MKKDVIHGNTLSNEALKLTRNSKIYILVSIDKNGKI